MPDIIRRNEHTNMPAYNDGEMDEEKDGEKDALAELAHTGQRGRAQDNEGEDRTEQRQKKEQAKQK